MLRNFHMSVLLHLSPYGDSRAVPAEHVPLAAAVGLRLVVCNLTSAQRHSVLKITDGQPVLPSDLANICHVAHSMLILAFVVTLVF